jgi:hypothetical protein
MYAFSAAVDWLLPTGSEDAAAARPTARDEGVRWGGVRHHALHIDLQAFLAALNAVRAACT